MWVDVEQRNGPPVRVWVNTKKPEVALRRALEETPGPGIATIQGHRNLLGRAYSDGIITIIKEVTAHNNNDKGARP